MTTKPYRIVLLAIGLLVLNAANAWAGEFNAIKDYDLLKFEESETDNWIQRIKANQLAEYECSSSDGCEAVALGVGVGGSTIINIRYMCPDGTKLLLLPGGVLVVPSDCDGSEAN